MADGSFGTLVIVIVGVGMLLAGRTAVEVGAHPGRSALGAAPLRDQFHDGIERRLDLGALEPLGVRERHTGLVHHASDGLSRFVQLVELLLEVRERRSEGILWANVSNALLGHLR